MLINKRENKRLKYFNDSKAFIEYSNEYSKIDKCNLNKSHKILIVFDDIITDMLSNRRLNPVVTELIIRGRKLSISLIFIAQSYFAVPENIRLNSRY